MPSAPFPLDENERLASLRALDLLDSDAEREFDELVKAAALVCDAPISLISLIDADRQWFKANTGLETTRETARESAFCAHAILGDAPLEVADASRDARFADNPLVLGDPGIRFYAGFPLRLGNGANVGTLCVIDRKPRVLSAHQCRILQHLANSAVSAMESRRDRRIADLAAGNAKALEERWRFVFEHLDDGFILGEVVRDAEGRAVDWRYVDINAAWSNMVGVALQDARGRTIREVFPGIEEDWVQQGIDIIGAREPMHFERQVGMLGRWYEGRTTWLGDDRFVISFSDVTQRRLTHQAQDALLRLSDAFNALPDGDRMLRRATELVAATLDVDVAAYGTMLDDGETLDVRCEWTRPGVASMVGTFWLPAYGTFLKDLRAGRTLVVDDVSLDVSMYAQACKAMGATSVVNIPVIERGKLVAIFVVVDRRPRRWSETPVAIEFLQQAVDRMRNAVERKNAELNLERLSASLVQQVEDRTAELQKANAVLAAKVEALSVAEDALRQAQKMEAVGQLTGGIAHDFNNLLASIGSSLQVLRMKLEKGTGGDLQRYIQLGMDSVTRAATLTQRLLAFSRRQSLDPKPVEVDRLLSGMQDLIRGTIGPSIHLEVINGEGVWPTLIDASQLENSILNLCINGRDAMAPDGGRLTIETANRWLDEDAARERELKPGQYTSVSVTDTGAGMPPAVIARAFDPFFTTKPMGQGTGLGLSMVYGFVRQSGGQIRIYSQPGIGTTVCLYLPRYAGQVVDETLQAAEPVSRSDGSETVLLVEDEVTIRQLLVEVLEGAGYRVLAVERGAGAMRLFEAGVKVDLLLTDVGLPGGMNGRQVADAARVAMPGLAVIFMTGYAESAIVGSGVLEDGMAMVTKPFELNTLVNKVRTMLDSAA